MKNKSLKREIYRAFEKIGAPIRVLCIIGGCGDTLSEEETVVSLKYFNDGGECKCLVESDDYILKNVEQAAKRSYNEVSLIKKEQDTFYHGTTLASWKLIQKEGCLWGYRVNNGVPTLDYRYTYLTPDFDLAKGHGNIVLEVEYTPAGIDGTRTDNYALDTPEGEYCWQFSVFVPIPIKAIKRVIKIEKFF